MRAGILASVLACQQAHRRSLQGVRRLGMSAASAAGAMNSHDKFLFDLNGFVVVRNVFSPDEVAAANAAIDVHQAKLCARTAPGLRNAAEGSPHSAQGPRLDMGGFLGWPKPHCDVFRSVLAHPRLVPYLNELCGDGYRLDHQPLVVAQDKDSEGFALHGGPISGDDGQPKGKFNPELQYRSVNGELWTSLLAVSVHLCDHGPGDGGFCIVRGSHKLNFPVPVDVTNGLAADFADHLYQPVTKAGDVVIWSEATVHGATPWRADRQRRFALYRFAPANMGYGRGYLELDQATYEGMTPLQRAVVEPPYASRLERPLVTAEAARDRPLESAPVKQRAESKKAFDYVRQP
jgi:ectoine hydroxylase-related dioxygenase (phytanoyl-CoA dioxygenase family)